MIKKTLITFALSVVAMIPAVGAPKQPNVLDLKHSITDSNIVFPESFETDTHKLMESWYLKNYTATDDRYRTQGDVPTDDAVIAKRLAALPTAIEMPFNKIVREYINRYTSRGREQVATILGLGNYYIPIFEQALEAEGLPLELKYLPVIESGLNPNAVSKHGATGLWQFMLATANGMDLEVNSLVDERRDPYASSKAAARYLHNLYDTYGDWSLAIAAYNCGPGSVNKAVRRAGGDPKKVDFWAIYKYLSPETRGYVPMFIACNYVMNYYDKHNISPVIPTKPLVTDTIGVSNRIHFNQISKILDIPVDELRILNPQYRADIIPGSSEKIRTLTLPSQQVHAYIMSENEIKGYEAERYAQRLTVEPGQMPGETSDVVIAEVDNLTAMTASRPEEETAPYESDNVLTNNGSSTQSPYATARQRGSRRNRAVAAVADTDNVPAVETPQPARQTSGKSSASSRNSKKSRNSSASAKPKTTDHTIKSGENLTKIAKKYGVSVDELKRANNMTNDNLRAGKSLKIPSKSSGSKKSKRRRR
ncbi:MAG: transglycosylase SLT domain-containing protein [Muribaculaceae bacterium]|nr:transglycosylase SLT domain-containing protein [Muribaculaceae bacterium]